MHFTKDDIMYAVELLVMLLLGLIVVLMVVRPMVKRILAPDPPPQPQLSAALAAGGDGGVHVAGADPEDLQGVVSPTARKIDMAKVQGQLHMQSVKKVGELADRNPHETVSIIRTWLHETV
jgi:flagellar M-ring protein FliF